MIFHRHFSEDFDEGDVKILEILARKYTQRGTNVVRYDQKNPFIHDLIRLGYLMQSPDTFKNYDFIFEVIYVYNVGQVTNIKNSTSQNTSLTT